MKRIQSHKLLLVVLLALLLLGGIKLGFWINGLVGRIQSEQEVITQLNVIRDNGITKVKPDELVTLAYQSSNNLEGLKQDLQPLYPLLGNLFWLPRIGPYLTQVEPGLEYGLTISHLSQSLAAASLPFWQLTQTSEGSGLPVNERFYQAYNASSPFLKQAAIDLAIVHQKREKLNADRLPVSYHEKLDLIDQSLPLLDKGLAYTPFISQLLGSDRPSTYLVMVQNSDELRPTGGFITAFGLVRIDQGKISMVQFVDSTKLNYVAKVIVPPEPLHQIMMSAYWVPRDANWSPDFPTAARQTQELYYSSTGYPTEGVVAFDQSFLVELIRFLGPLKVSEDLPEITADNLVTEMVNLKMAAINANEYQNRKSFISMFAPVIMHEVLQIHDINKIMQLIKLMGDQAQTGHILFYSNNLSLQNVLVQEHLAGQIDPGNGDFLMVVDSNVGFGKNDPFMRRSFTYDLDLTDINSPKANVVLHYENSQIGAPPCDMRHDISSDDYYLVRCYWDYWRLYTSQGTRLIKSQFVPVPADYFKPGYSWKNEIDVQAGEGSTQVFGGLTVVAPAEHREINLQLAIPSTVIKQDAEGFLHYTLRLQKQPGIQNMKMMIKIHPPLGYHLVKFPTDSDYSLDSDSWQWQGNLSFPRDFELVYSTKNE